MEGKEKMGHMTVEEWESRKQSLTADPNDHTAESGADDRREVWWQGAQPNCRPYILTADQTAWLQTQHPDCRPNMNDRELNAAYITSTNYGVPWVMISQYMHTCPILLSLKVCCISFWIFLLVVKGPVSISLPLWYDRSQRTEEWRLHFARKHLTRKGHTKMNQVLQLARSFQMQKPTGCGMTTRKCQLLTDSLSPPRHTHRHENDFLNIYIFWCNDVIMCV